MRYFRTIHLWYPIISEEVFYQRLPDTYTKPCAESSLLLLSIALITVMPSNNEIPMPLYTAAKTSIAMTEAANIHTLMVVKARLLVTLFEVGHNLDPAAFISLGATARAAVAIGLNQSVHYESGNSDSTLANSQEGLCVWWAIVMLDRSVFYRSNYPASSCSPNPTIHKS